MNKTNPEVKPVIVPAKMKTEVVNTLKNEAKETRDKLKGIIAGNEGTLAAKVEQIVQINKDQQNETKPAEPEQP